MKITKLIAAFTLLAAMAVSAQEATNKVGLAWDLPPEDEEVSGYVLYHKLASETAFEPVLRIPAIAVTNQVTVNVTNAWHTNAIRGVNDYRMTATNFWGIESEPSETVSTPEAPAQVMGLMITRTATGIQLNWAPNAVGEEIDGYRVYRGTNVADIDSFSAIGVTTNVTIQEVMNPGFAAFFVTASNYWGEGFRSEIITVPPLPTAPAGFQISQ